MKKDLNFKRIISLALVFVLLGCFPIYDQHRVFTDFQNLKAFLDSARYSSLYDNKSLVVRFKEGGAEPCIMRGQTIQTLPLPTLHQVNYDTTIGRDMIVFTPSGTSQYNARIHGGDIRLRSWLGFEKNIAVNCNGLVQEGVYPVTAKRNLL